jgi:acyl-CoA thioesterase
MFTALRSTTLVLVDLLPRCNRVCVGPCSSHSYSIFSADTAVSIASADSATRENLGVTETSHAKFSGTVTSNWNVGDAPNGGYLMGIAISAARNVIPFRDPLSVTAYYTNKAVSDAPVDISVQTLNKTKGTATVAVSLTQNQIHRSHYVGTFGTLSAMKGLNFSNLGAAPQLPPPEKCYDCSHTQRTHFGALLPLAHRVSFRAAHDDPFVETALSGKYGTRSEASLTCWVRFEEAQLPGLRSFAFFCDALPPPIIGVTPSHWVPTLEYTVHLWQRADFSRRASWVPAGATLQSHPYWLRCRYNTPVAVNGMLYTDAELWSEDGSQLLATARQLARVLTPR